MDKKWELDPLTALRVEEGKRIAFRIAQEREEARRAEALRWFAERLRQEAEVAQ